jgi:hypothetical protein
MTLGMVDGKSVGIPDGRSVGMPDGRLLGMPDGMSMPAACRQSLIFSKSTPAGLDWPAAGAVGTGVAAVVVVVLGSLPEHAVSIRAEARRAVEVGRTRSDGNGMGVPFTGGGNGLGGSGAGSSVGGMRASSVGDG